MNTTTNSSKGRRFPRSLSDLWKDQVAAHRAMASLAPYYDRQRQDGR